MRVGNTRRRQHRSRSASIFPRGATHHAPENSAESRFGFVADCEGDRGEAVLRAPELIGREPHPPTDQIVERRLTDCLAEPHGEGGARHAGDVREFGKPPASGGFGMKGTDGFRQALVGKRAQPAGAWVFLRGQPKPKNLEQHDLRKVFGHERAAGRTVFQFRRKLLKREAQHRGLVRSVAHMDDSRQRAEQHIGMVARKRKATTHQKEIASTVARRNTVHRRVINGRGLDRWQCKVSRKDERTSARQQEAISGFDPLGRGLALYRHPAGAAHYRIELDAFVWRETDRPVTARIETGTDRTSWLQQRENFRQRVQRDKSERSRMNIGSYRMDHAASTDHCARDNISPMSRRSIMIDQQKPLRSGFGPATTAAEVLTGIDLSGKVAVITGGHSGLGLETTKALAGAGAQIIVGSRHPAAAETATKNVIRVTVDELNLADLDSVRSFAERILAAGLHIDMLINNAGIMACAETRVSPGWESQFATNHLGHFALTNRLWPALQGGARVIMVSSAGHHNSPIRWDDIQFTRGYDKWLAYGQSKTANALFAVHLDRLGRDHGIRAFSLHPGKIFTPLQRHLTQAEMTAEGWLDVNGAPADPTFKTPSQGAATQVWAATSAQIDGLGGLYCEDCDIAVRAETASEPFVGVKAYAADADEAERLWGLSAELTQIGSH